MEEPKDPKRIKTSHAQLPGYEPSQSLFFNQKTMEEPKDPKRIKTSHAQLSGAETSSFVNQEPVVIKDLLAESDAQQKIYASKALLCYNKKMGTNFTFETMVDYSIGVGYSHMNFIGKAPLKLFFAEISFKGGKVITITTCTIVEPDNPLFRVGCGFCHPNGLIYHPPFKYLGGHYRYRGGHTVSPYLEQKKVDFMNLYKCDYVVKKLDGDDLHELKKKANAFANMGLEEYNKRKYYADYALLEVTGVVRFVEETTMSFGLWLHLNFKAKNRNPECNDPDVQQFFCEVCMLDDHYEAFISSFFILNDKELDDETRIRCGICTTIRHPSQGFDARFRGTILAVWDPSELSFSWIRKYDWRYVGESMDIDRNLVDESISSGDLPIVDFIAPSSTEGRKPATIKGKQVLGDLQLDSHHIPMDRFPMLIDFRDIFSEYGGHEQLGKLRALSDHYELLFLEHVASLSWEEKLSLNKTCDEMVNFFRSPGFYEIHFEDQERIVANATMSELKNLEDQIVKSASTSTAGLINDLPGLAHDDIIEKLNWLHTQGVRLISEMCYAAVSRLLMLGRSLVYNAQEAAGKLVKCGIPIDTDILDINWPVDCFGKAEIIKIRREEMKRYLVVICYSCVEATSKCAEVCLASTKGPTRESIREKVDQDSKNLLVARQYALEMVQYGISFLADLVSKLPYALK